MLESDLNLKRPGPRETKKGITLIEILIAAGILTFVCSILFLTFVNCIILNESSRNLTRATAHAQYVMEDIKNSDFSSLESNIGNATWDWDAAAIASRGLNALEDEVIDVNEAGIDADLLNVVVNITWQDRGVRTQTISLETLIVEP